MKRTLTCLLGLAAFIVSYSAPVSAGPLTPYYLTNGDGSTISVVQGNSIVDTITMSNRQYGIAVSDTVRTIGWSVADQGQEFQLDGTPTGVTYTAFGQASLTDGATNGVDTNFGIRWNTGEIFAFDRDWENGVPLFTVSSTFGGIAYDTSNNTLWVNNRSSGETRNYSLTGTFLSSFTASSNVGWSLAYEEASDSLWYISDNITGTLFNYSKTGALLEQVAIPGLTGNILGGEMAILGTSPIPEPSSVVLLGLGTIGFLFTQRRRNQKLSV